MLLSEYVGGAFPLTPMENVLKGLPFTTIGDLFCFIGVLVVAGLIIIWTVWKIASAIKGQDDKIYGGD